MCLIQLIDVQQAVARELNLDEIPKPNDAADALAVALAASWLTDGGGLGEAISC